MKIEDIKNHLHQIKTSQESWNAFAYVKDEKGKDANYMKRYALAIELQYCYTPDDKELVKFLMEQEVKCRRHDPFQGIGTSLNLLSYLLATYRKPEHVWLFEQAKYANFDTYCGYNSEFIFSAGVEVTCNYLENYEITEDHPYLFERKEELRSIYTETDIEIFLEEMNSWFPNHIEEESIIALLDRAIEFGNEKEGKRLFQLLEQEGESSDEGLFYYAKSIKNYEKAIYYQNQFFENLQDVRDKASSLLKIAEIHLLSNDPIRSFETAKRWDSLLGEFSSWQETGLGLSLTEICFDLCLGFYKQDHKDLAFISFQKGADMLEKLEHGTLHLFEKANECCEKLGISDKQRYYKQLAEGEKKRIDRLV